MRRLVETLELRLGEAGFLISAFDDAHAQIEPRGLAGDGVGVRALDAVRVARQLGTER